MSNTNNYSVYGAGIKTGAAKEQIDAAIKGQKSASPLNSEQANKQDRERTSEPTRMGIRRRTTISRLP